MGHATELWVTATLFALTYVGLALGKIPGLRMDRAGIALVGATLMMATGMLSLEQAVSRRSVDYATLGLLFGMMVVIAYLRLAGFFQRLARWSLRRIRSPRGLLAVVIALSGLLSAFLVNDIVCLTLTPLVLHLARKLKFDPVPHLLGLATASNIGSTGTITGNPQNMIIGIRSHIPYLHFALRLMPVALLGLVLDYLVISFTCRRRLRVLEETVAGLPGGPAPEKKKESKRIRLHRVHHWLLGKSVTVTLITVILFFALPSEHLPVIALGAAAVLLLGRVKPEKVFRQVDWDLLVMFTGLFIVVRAFQIHVVSRWGVKGWTWLLESPVFLLSLVSLGLSNLVSNVPAVLLFEPIVQAMAEAKQNQAWLALAMSSTFAGNLTVLGSVANLIVVENARREGVEVSFGEYCKVGIPVTLLTLALGILWLEFVPY